MTYDATRTSVDVTIPPDAWQDITPDHEDDDLPARSHLIATLYIGGSLRSGHHCEAFLVEEDDDGERTYHGLTEEKLDQLLDAWDCSRPELTHIGDGDEREYLIVISPFD